MLLVCCYNIYIMAFSFITNNKEKIIAIFDIGTGSVGGALVKIPTDDKGLPTIIKSTRTEIKFRKNFEFGLFIEDMIGTLSNTAQSLYNMKAGAPEEIFCVLASPWYLSETRIIKMSQKKPFIFSKHLASSLITKEVQTLMESFKAKYGDLESLPEMIEQHTMSVALNGYNTRDPLGKKCNFIEMSMIISLSPKLCVDKMRETLSKIFHHTPVSFSSFTIATYFAVREKYIVPDSYLLLDISGEITDVGIVSKGVLKSSLSFPFGKKTFFDYICTKLEIELRDAKEIFKLYSEGTLSLEHKNKIEPLFKSIENSWGEAFDQCIATLPRTLVLPNTIFLTADNDIRKWFASALEKDEHIKSVINDNKCTVVTLEGPEFLNMCDVKEGGCDSFLMIEAIAIMRKMANK